MLNAPTLEFTEVFISFNLDTGTLSYMAAFFDGSSLSTTGVATGEGATIGAAAPGQQQLCRLLAATLAPLKDLGHGSIRWKGERSKAYSAQYGGTHWFLL